MSITLRRRVKELEMQKNAGNLGDPAVIGAAESLSNDELDAMIAAGQAHTNDPRAEPSAEQRAAFEKFERRRRELQDEAQQRKAGRP